MSGKTGWRCDNCGQIHYSDEPPDECPYCLFPNKPFKKV
jgi:acyl-CoA dehydrogenase